MAWIIQYKFRQHHEDSFFEELRRATIEKRNPNHGDWTIETDIIDEHPALRLAKQEKFSEWHMDENSKVDKMLGRHKEEFIMLYAVEIPAEIEKKVREEFEMTYETMKKSLRK